MQVFRLMNLPDRVIAFDSLPESMVSSFEMCRADAFPRHWKEWMGKKKKIIPIPPEKDFLTGQVRRFDPIIEEDSFFYLVDWNIQPCVEKWQEVCAYVRNHVDKETKLLEKITDMAVKLAPNKTDGVTLEPEEVPVIKIVQDTLVDSKGVDIRKNSAPVTTIKKTPKSDLVIKCDEADCDYEAKGVYAKNSVRFHKSKMHKEVVAPTV